MSSFLRVLFFMGAILLATARTQAQSVSTTPPVMQYPKAQPVVTPTPSRPVVPAFLDVVTFDFHADGEYHKVVVTAAPTLLRVDEPIDGYSILYDPATEHYVGLENRNYQWWEFSWPEVRDIVENSKRHEDRLQQLGIEGLNADSSTPDANPAPATSTSTDGDDSGYVWHPTNDHKEIAGLDCIHWVGDTVSGDHLEAWCAAGVLPKVEAAIERLRLINEPMALVPVRTIAPDTIFPVYEALAKGGVTPLLITWGENENKSDFRLVDIKTREGKLSLFAVPKLYIKTTLVTMDGMLPNQQVVQPYKSDKPQTTWQNPSANQTP